MVLITLLTIHSKKLKEPIRLASNYQNVISNGKLYYACPLEIEIIGLELESTNLHIKIPNYFKTHEDFKMPMGPVGVELSLVNEENSEIIELGPIKKATAAMPLKNSNYIVIKF